jgi:hypothetical protein
LGWRDKVLADIRLGGCSDASRTGGMLLEQRAHGVNFNKGYVVTPEIGEVL